MNHSIAKSGLSAVAIAAAAVFASGSAFAAIGAPIVTTTNSPTAGANTEEVYSIGPDGHLRYTSLSVFQGWTNYDISNYLLTLPSPSALPTVGSPLAYAHSTSGPDELFWLSADGHVHQTTSVPGQLYTNTDLTAATGSPIAAAGSPMTALALPGAKLRVYYQSTFGRIQEIAFDGAGHWTTTDLTAATGNTMLGTVGTPMASTVIGGANPRVYFFNTINHVAEMAASSGWHTTDLNVATGTNPPAQGSALTSVTFSGTSPHVFYFDVNNHVHELASSSSWHDTDLTNSTGTPVAMRGTGMTSFVLNNGANPKVYYTSYDGHIRQLTWSGSWSKIDLSGDLCAAPVAPNSLLSSYSSTNINNAVFYMSTDGHLRELLNSNQDWSGIDINGSGTSTTCAGDSGGVGGGIIPK